MESANIEMRHGSFHTPFDAATLARLYRNHGAYVSAVDHVTNDNLAAGYILNEDAQTDIQEAAQSGKLVIEADRIAKSYGERAIVRNFGLRVERGEIPPRPEKYGTFAWR